jgi:hypothetical protein
VLHIRRILEEDEEAPYLDTDIELFVLVNSTWDNCGGGGANWPGSVPSWEEDGSLTRIEVSPDHVDLGGIVGSDSETVGCKALWGDVGTAAAIAELSQGGQLTRRRVEAPLGAFVVCGDASQPLTVRILDARGELLTQIEEPAGFERPPWTA